jgi:hypothetical protein
VQFLFNEPSILDWLLLQTGKPGSSALGGEVVFRQTFSRPFSEDTYIREVPDGESFSRIDTEEGAGEWTVNDNGELELKFQADVENGGYFVCQFAESEAEGIAEMSFDLRISDFEDGWSGLMMFVLGERTKGGMGYVSSSAKLGVFAHGRDQYHFRFDEVSSDPLPADTPAHVQWFINTTGGPGKYTGPDNQVYELADLTMDLWVNGTRFSKEGRERRDLDPVH